eukprot:2349567-Rhodomonas_salina.2
MTLRSRDRLSLFAKALCSREHVLWSVLPLRPASSRRVGTAGATVGGGGSSWFENVRCQSQRAAWEIRRRKCRIKRSYREHTEPQDLRTAPYITQSAASLQHIAQHHELYRSPREPITYSPPKTT